MYSSISSLFVISHVLNYASVLFQSGEVIQFLFLFSGEGLLASFIVTEKK